MSTRRRFVKAMLMAGAIIAFMPSYAWKTVMATTKATTAARTLSISPTSETGPTPNAVTFTGKLLNRRGKPVASTTVYLFSGPSGGTRTNVANAVTDSTGSYSIPYTFTPVGSSTCNTSDNTTNS